MKSTSIRPCPACNGNLVLRYYAGEGQVHQCLHCAREYTPSQIKRQ